MFTSFVLFGLLSLKEPAGNGLITGTISEGYNCNAYLKYPILETDDYYLTINDHALINKYGDLKVSVFDKDLNLIQRFPLDKLYIVRRKLSNDILESLFLDSKGEPCVLYSTIDRKTDRANVMKARIDLQGEKLVELTSVMAFDVPKINIAASVNVSHWGEGNAHHVMASYYKYMLGTVQYDVAYNGYFNAKFEPESEHNGDVSMKLYSPNDISVLGFSRLWRLRSTQRHLNSSLYRFDFSSEEGENELKVLKVPRIGDAKELLSIELANDYVGAQTHYSEQESTLTFFSFKYTLDKKGYFESIEGFNICRLDANDFHLIDEESHLFTSKEKSKILTDIDNSGRGKISPKELDEGISPYKFQGSVEFFSSDQFVVLLRDARSITKTTESRIYTEYEYGDFIYMGYSGGGKIDFLDRVHVEESSSGQAAGGRLNTYHYNNDLYLLYKNGEKLKHQKLLKTGDLISLSVDKGFNKGVAELDLDFTNMDLQPGTFVFSATDKFKFHLVRMIIPE